MELQKLNTKYVRDRTIDPKPKEWFSALWVVLMATATVIVFVYQNFQTRREAEELTRRIDRIEEKIDRLLQRTP